MSFNQIVTKKALGSVVTRSGRTYVLTVATKTTYWERPDAAADLMKEPLEKAVLANESILPAATVEVCGRDANHKNPNGDNRTHITAVTFDETGKLIKTVHLLQK